MLPSSKAVKKTARTALSGKISQSVFASVCAVVAFLMAALIEIFTYTVFGAVISTVIWMAMLLMLLVPLCLGELYYFRRLIWEQDDSVSLVFHYFEDSTLYFEALAFGVGFIIRLIIFSAIFFLPAITCRLLSNNSFYITFGSTMPSWAPNLQTVAAILDVAAGVAVFCAMLKYFCAPFIFVAGDIKSPFDAFKISAATEKTFLQDIFWTVMSFIGWLLLSLLVVPLIVTLPYLLTSYCVHCRFIIAAYNKKVTEIKKDSPSFEV